MFKYQGIVSTWEKGFQIINNTEQKKQLYFDGILRLQNLFLRLFTQVV